MNYFDIYETSNMPFENVVFLYIFKGVESHNKIEAEKLIILILERSY
jgi:hypothetical protein